MRIEVDVRIDAPPEVVWDLLVEWERQPEWMVDATAVEVRSAHRAGEGVTICVPTNLLGVTVDDVMRVTRWEPERVLEVVHLGRVIAGIGAFELRSRPPGGTHLTWWEEIDPPLGRLGAWAATRIVRPVVERIFRRSLGNLAALAAAEVHPRGGP